MKDMKIPGIILSVKFYKTDNKTEPVREWIKNLNHNQKKTIGEDIKTVQFGWPIGMPVVRKIEAGLWEVRSKFKEDIARVLFTIVKNEMVLLHGFIKKSQKISKDDLNLTLKRKMKLLKQVNYEK